MSQYWKEMNDSGICRDITIMCMYVTLHLLHRNMFLSFCNNMNENFEFSTADHYQWSLCDSLCLRPATMLSLSLPVIHGKMTSSLPKDTEYKLLVKSKKWLSFLYPK